MSAYNYTRVFEASGVFIVVTMVVFLGFFIALLRRSDIKGHTNHFIIWLLLVICIVLYAIAGVIMACINLNIDLCQTLAQYVTTLADLDVLILHWVYVWEVYVQSVYMRRDDVQQETVKKYFIINIASISVMVAVFLGILVLQFTHVLNTNSTLLLAFEFIEELLIFVVLLNAFVNIRKTIAEHPQYLTEAKSILTFHFVLFTLLLVFMGVKIITSWLQNNYDGKASLWAIVATACKSIVEGVFAFFFYWLLNKFNGMKSVIDLRLLKALKQAENSMDTQEGRLRAIRDYYEIKANEDISFVSQDSITNGTRLAQVLALFTNYQESILLLNNEVIERLTEHQNLLMESTSTVETMSQSARLLPSREV